MLLVGQNNSSSWAATFAQIKDIEGSIPFANLGFDSDNGGKFLNYHLYCYFVNRKIHVQFTRSCAYKKMIMLMLNRKTGLLFCLAIQYLQNEEYLNRKIYL